MSEDDLIFAISLVSGDINDHMKTVSKAENALSSLSERLTRQKMVGSVTREALENLVRASVASLGEYKPLELDCERWLRPSDALPIEQ